MNMNAKCTDGTQLDGAAIEQSEKPDSSQWSAWQVCLAIIYQMSLY